MKKIIPIIALTILLQPFSFVLAQTNSSPDAEYLNNIQAENEAPQGSRLDYSGFVNCDGVVKKGEPNRQRVCDFAALMALVNKIINWIFVISMPVATVLFAYAGLLYIRGTQEGRKKANSIFVAVVVGFIIMLVAWFSIRTLVDFFVESNFGATSLVK